MRTFRNAVFAAVVSVFFLLPLAALADGTCALDKTVNEGGVTYPKCPLTANDDALRAAPYNYNALRLDPDVTQSATPVWVHGTCAYVDAAGISNALFIPVNSEEEWNAFLNNTPSGVQIANCCVPRAMTVGDVKRPAQSCSGANKWVLLGLVSSADHGEYLARPLSTRASAQLMESYDCPGCDGGVGMRALQLPIARDDTGATAPGSDGTYTAAWICGNSAPQYVDFRLQCNDGEWGADTGITCTASQNTSSKSCPSGQSGTITVTTRHVCDGSNNGAGQNVVSEDNQCYATPVTPSCVEVHNQITQKACPSGSTGTIYVYTSHYCDGSNNGAGSDDVGENNQCTLVNQPTTPNSSCVEVHNRITQKACPSGSTGTIFVYTSHFCDGSNNGAGKDEVSENNQCTLVNTPSPSSNCKSTTSVSQKACPSGTTGTIYVYTSHYCDGSNNGAGKDEVSENNQCTLINTPTPQPNCATSQNVSTRSCPSGYSGTIYVYTSHYCDGSNNGTGRDAVSENNQCSAIVYPSPYYYKSTYDYYYYDPYYDSYYTDPYVTSPASSYYQDYSTPAYDYSNYSSSYDSGYSGSYDSGYSGSYDGGSCCEE